jgi:hypothetical protein
VSQDGQVIQAADQDFEERAWALDFRDLVDSEWNSLEALYAATQGRFGTFTFLEPGANLLRWSEELAVSPWTVVGTLAPGQPDPVAGSSATQLSASGSVSQSITAPSHFRYVATAWLKTAGDGASLRLSDGAGAVFERPVSSGNEWTRYSVAYQASTATDTVVFSIHGGSGAPVDIYGPQLEAQTSPSPYKRSTDTGGVFSSTRFDQDALIDEAVAPERHDTRIRLVWTPSQI